MKFRPSYKGKMAILITFVILFLGSVYYSYEYVLAEEQEVKEERLLLYEHTGEFDYYFTMKDNRLYGEGVLEEGKCCFTKIVDKLYVNYTSEMTLSNDAMCCTEYRAFVDVHCEYWNITEEITSDNSNDGLIESSFEVDFGEIVEFIDGVEKELEVFSRVYYVDIRVPVDVKIEASSQTVNERYENICSFAIESEVIKPQEGEPDSKDVGEITRTITEVKTSSSAKKSGFVFLNIMLASGALLSYAYIKPHEISMQERLHKKAKKKFHDYMIDAYGQPPMFNLPVISVSNLGELARIAEGLNKPIMHFYINGMHKYYIMTENLVYQFSSK